EYTGTVNLRSVLHHLDTGWQRRDAGNVAMFHYGDYSTDLPSELGRLARVLGISVTETRARELAAEASLARMRSRADDVAPNAGAIWKDTAAFFRSGGFGEWRKRVTSADLDEYNAVVGATVDPELAQWVHGGRIASGIDPAG
ncbi:MAG: sulfotransferase domain-containing protein, partial [Acidimicrobiia bacterium]